MNTLRNSRNTYEQDENEIQTPDQPAQPKIPNPRAQRKNKQKDDSCGCGSSHDKEKNS